MTAVYNKITREWTDTGTPEDLSSDWVVDPVFTDKDRAMTIGPKYWLYDGNIITSMTDEQISTDPTFLAEDQQKIWILIENERDRRITSGGYKVGNYWFQSDSTSRIQQLGLNMMGTNMPNGIMWKTMSNDYVSMTPTLALQIFQAAAASDVAIFSIAEQKRIELMASSNPSAYDYLSGWPLIYGE